MVKSFCVCYRVDEDRWWFVQNGTLDILFDLMRAKQPDLSEAAIVALLNLCSHPDIPPLIMDAGGLPLFCQILCDVEFPVTLDLVTILLKVYFPLPSYQSPTEGSVVAPVEPLSSLYQAPF